MLTIPDSEPSMRLLLVVLLAGPVLACGRSEREQQLAECVAIYRTAYATGGVRECLVKRHGWSAGDAADAEKEMDSHPDSAAHADSGQVGDSLRK